MRNVSARAHFLISLFIMGPSLFQIPRQEFDAEKSKVINDIFNKSQLGDVTLLNGQDEFSAHKLVLASVSPVLRSVFERNSQSPLLFLRGTESRLIKSMLSFIYTGEASVEVRDIDEFIKLGNDFELKGLNSKEEEQEKRDFVKKIEEKFSQVEEKQKVISSDQLYSSQEDLVKLKNNPYIKSYEDSVNQMFVIENETRCRCLSCGLTKSRKMIKRHVESHLDGAFEYKCNNCGKTFDRLYKLMLSKFHPCHVHLDLSILDDDQRDKYQETRKIDSIVNEFSLALTDNVQPMDESSLELEHFESGDKNLNKEEVKSEPISFQPSQTAESKNYERDLRRRVFSTEYFQEYDKKLMAACERLDKQVFKCKVCGKIAANRAHIMEHAESHLKGEFQYVCKCGTTLNRKGSVRMHLPCPEAIEHDRQMIQRQIERTQNAKNGSTLEENDGTGTLSPLVVPVSEYEVMIDKFLNKNMEPPHNWLCTNTSCEFNQTNARTRDEALRHIEEVHLPHVTFTCDTATCFERFEKYTVYRKHSKTCEV